MEENETITQMLFKCLVSAHEEKIANKSVCYLGSQYYARRHNIHSLSITAFASISTVLEISTQAVCTFKTVCEYSSRFDIWFSILGTSRAATLAVVTVLAS